MAAGQLRQGARPAPGDVFDGLVGQDHVGGDRVLLGPLPPPHLETLDAGLVGTGPRRASPDGGRGQGGPGGAAAGPLTGPNLIPGP